MFEHYSLPQFQSTITIIGHAIIKHTLPQFQSTITIIGHAVIKHTLTFLYEIQYDLLQDLPKILRKQTTTAKNI